MTAPSAAQRLLAEIDEHDRQDAAAASKAARMRPDVDASVPGLPAELAHAERRTVLGVPVPGRRSLWPELQEYDTRVTDLQARQHDVEAHLQDLREQRVNAPSRDAQAAADWEIAGRRGTRPEATAERLDTEIASVERERDGLQVAVDRALEDRAAFITANRQRLTSVPSQQKRDAHLQLLAQLDEVVRTRDLVAELAAAERWVRLFPHELASAEPLTHLLGGGLRQVMEPLGLNVQVDYAKMVETLKADANWVRDAAASNQQRALLEGRDPSRPSGSTWADSDEARAERKAELEATVAAFRNEWGRQPSENELHAFIEARRFGR